MDLGAEKYILLTTYRRNGAAVSTPVWVVALDDGSFGFWTSSKSGKAKRLGHNEAVRVQPCDARGRVRDGAPVLEASAHVVGGAELDEIRRRVKAKYGLMTKVTPVLQKIGNALKRQQLPYGDVGVKLTLRAPETA